MTALYQLVTASNTTIELDVTNGVVVEQAFGMGMPPVSNLTTDYAVLDGGSWQRAKAQQRVVTLQIAAQGTSVDGTNGLHKIRATLLNAVNPHRHGANAMRLNYTGNTDGIRYLSCRYDAGLEGNDWRGFTEMMTLRLLATDPFWQANTGATSTAPTKEVQDLDYIASWTDGVWSSMGGGMEAEVQSLAAKPGGGVYAGGVFDTAGSTGAQGVAVWSGTAWSALNVGVTRGGDAHSVRAIKVAPNGDVYVGGLFSAAGSTAARSIACWDVSASAWTALNVGMETGATVRAIGIDGDGDVYAGGDFSTAGSTAAPAVAVWNGSRWAALGAGMPSGYVTALAVDAEDKIYAGGTFNTAGGAAAARIAVWSGTAWATLGSGFGTSVTSYPYALDYDRTRGYLYAGGAFSTVGGVAVSNVARWNGRHWEPLGSGVTDVVRAVRVLDSGWVLVAGDFITAGGHRSYYAALWNGYSWVPIPAGAIGQINAFAEDASNGAWYLGGNYTGNKNVSGRKTLTNAGSAKAYPVITVTAAAASQRLLYIRNDTTDQTLWFDYALQDGETLTIDCRPGYKTVTSSFYGDQVSDNPLPGSQLATFCLNPGGNYISTFVYGASTTVTFTWTPAYWGLD